MIITNLIGLITIIFALHAIGDFLLQRPEIGKTKSWNPLSLIEHIIIYTLTLMVGVLILFPGDFWTKIDFLAVNAYLHFFTDYYTAPLFNKVTEKRGLHNPKPFPLNTGSVGIFGLDQALHFWALMATTIFYFN